MYLLTVCEIIYVKKMNFGLFLLVKSSMIYSSLVSRFLLVRLPDTLKQRTCSNIRPFHGDSVFLLCSGEELDS